ncbi:MAG: 3-dehydroquinate synthase [Leptospirales bacterium]|nr:3-dehydroquinate synthase [Leptospirales bacterium]
MLHEAVTVQPQSAAAYPVYIEPSWDGLFDNRLLENFNADHIFVISQRGLRDYVLRDLLSRLTDEFPGALEDRRVVYMGEGEESKSFSALEEALSKLVREGANRRSLILAVGGGVVGDFAGLAAALLSRGTRFVQLPSTLLAAVDSSVGGKTAVNIGVGKNMIGAFHHPVLVYFNQSLLGTLPEREWSCGLSEMCKHACMDSAEMLSRLAGHASLMRQPASVELRQALIDSVRFKARVVSEDDRENGLRAILNLGHTTAHAIESLAGYGRFLHGEAVARGLVTALLLSMNKVGLPEDEAQRALEAMAALRLPRDCGGLEADALFDHMQFDKKNYGGQVRFVLLQRIGQPLYDQPVTQAEFRAAWAEQGRRFGRNDGMAQ